MGQKIVIIRERSSLPDFISALTNKNKKKLKKKLFMTE